MKIQCWSLGKANEPYIKDAVEMFTKRVSNYFPIEWTIINTSKVVAGSERAIMQKNEAELILSRLKQDDFLVLLDESGKQISSEGLATLIQQQANESRKNLIFLIGGAYGVSDDIKKKANYIWSLSFLVFPHQIVRLILAEQLYRASSILRNEKYHHQ